GRLRQQRQLRRGQYRSTFFSVRRRPRPQITTGLANAIVAGTAGDDAIVVVGKALRLGEGLMSTSRTAHEIRMVWKLSRMVSHDEFRDLSRHVNRTIRPIHDLLRMTLPKLEIVAGVPRVGACGCITTLQRRRHRRIRDAARVAAIADTLKLSIPRFHRWNP